MASAARGIFRRLGSTTRNVLALVGLGTVGYVAVELQTLRSAKKEQDDTKSKRVLVVPFHRLRLVEHKEHSGFDRISQLRDMDDPAKPIEMEVKELVEILHTAAGDPNVVALYGIFGHGSSFQTGGWAHNEEIRNALRVFRESHRVHKEPNLSHDSAASCEAKPAKSMYAFADTFGYATDYGKEYYIASGFDQIHLQSKGEIGMLGLASPTLFLRDTLKKYGIKVHVAKHGQYKNSPNMFTEIRFTKPHRKNVENMIHSVNRMVHTDIFKSRSSKLGSTWPDPFSFMEAVHAAGNFTALGARKYGLIDFCPDLDPLDDLVLSNKDDGEKEKLKAKWGNSTDIEKFAANKAVTLTQYKASLAKRKSAEEFKWKVYDRLKDAADRFPLVTTILSTCGYAAPSYNFKKDEFLEDKAKSRKEKIALIHVNGVLAGESANKILDSLRKIKKDKNIKAVVFRVDCRGGVMYNCESVLQECKDMPQKTVFSFGNVSASGGYYIATNADRVFASRMTITGSIGVFGIRPDLTGLAAQYGARFDHVNCGNLSAIYSPFHPFTREMKAHFARSIDRCYSDFVQTVAAGRQMTTQEVMDVAEGRVWTGEQAKEIGLIDEIGGLERAICYARRNFTSGAADVVVWPRRKSFFENLRSQSEGLSWSDIRSIYSAFSILRMAIQDSIENPYDRKLGFFRGLQQAGMFDLDAVVAGLASANGASSVVMAMDENAAIECLVQDNVS